MYQDFLKFTDRKKEFELHSIPDLFQQKLPHFGSHIKKYFFPTMMELDQGIRSGGTAVRTPHNLQDIDEFQGLKYLGRGNSMI